MAGLVVLFIWCSSPTASDQARERSEGTAAFLYGLAKFVTWPENAFESTEDRFVVGAVGDGAVCETLTTIQGKRVHGREVVVKRVMPSDALPPCHLIFVDQEAAEAGVAVLALAKDHPVLTVSNAAGFAQGGGMIFLDFVGRKIGFEVNLDAVNAGGLRISSQLLKQAQIVWTGIGCGDD